MAAGVQKFCLRWNDFQGLVTSAFNCLRKDEELVDVTLCCEGRTIKAHKMMLSACSPYFKEVLKGNPCQHPVFFMKDVKYSDMAAIMDFVYTGEVNVAQNSLSGFLKTAEALQVRGLTEDSQGSGPAGDGPGLGSPAPSEHAVSSRLKRATPPASDPAASTASPSSAKRSRHRSRSPPSLQPEEPSPATHVPVDEPAVVGDDTWDEQKVKLETLEEEESGLDGVLESHDSLDGMLNFQGAGTLPVEASIHGEGAGDSSAGYIPDLSAPDGVSWARGGPRGPADAVPGARPATRPCPVCGKRYRHRQSLHKHVQMHRGRTRCHVCGETLATVETLTHHLRNRHSVEKDQLISLL